MTRISIGGVQDRDTLKHVADSVMEFSKSACTYTYNEVHWSV